MVYQTGPKLFSPKGRSFGTPTILVLAGLHGPPKKDDIDAHLGEAVVISFYVHFTKCHIIHEVRHLVIT